MKKFKKVIALGLAAMAAVSAMAIPTFAAESDVETETCTVYVTEADGTTRSFDMDIDVPVSFTDGEEETYVMSQARSEAGLADENTPMTISSSTRIASNSNYTVYQNAGTTATNAAVFRDKKFGQNYNSLGVYVKKLSGSYNMINARLNWDNDSTVAYFLDKELDLSSKDITVWFIDGRYPDGGSKIDLNSTDRYSLYLSGQDGSGRASVTVTGYID